MSCGQNQYWNGIGLSPQGNLPEFPFLVEVEANVAGLQCQGAIVNTWFIATHSSCCPATSVKVKSNGNPTNLAAYVSFIHEELCLVQLVEPVNFGDFFVQPICVDFKCPLANAKAIAVQLLNSKETTSYQRIVYDSHCQANLSPAYKSNLEICSSPLQRDRKCDPNPPKVLGHPLVTYQEGRFILAGLFSTADVLPPGAPYDAAGYAAICKDNSWAHQVAFCGYTDYVKPPSAVLGFSQSNDALIYELPFFVGVDNGGVLVAGSIIGPRHVVTDQGAPASFIIYGLTIEDYPQHNYTTWPSDKKISVINIVDLGAFKLLTLAEEFPFFNDDGTLNKKVQPICLPTDCGFVGAKPNIGESLKLAGIGRLASSDYPATVQVSELTVTDLSQCSSEAMQATDWFHDGYYFCADHYSCFLDWGGPVYREIGGKYFLISYIISVGPCSTISGKSKLCI